MDDEHLVQPEQQAQSFKKLKSQVQDKIEKEVTPENSSYGDGMHEAIEDCEKAI